MSEGIGIFILLVILATTGKFYVKEELRKEMNKDDI